MGLDVTFKSNADEVLRELEIGVKRALEAVGLQAEGNAKDLCPWKTGRLRGSITFATVEKHGSGQAPAKPEDWDLHGTPEEKSVYIGTNVEYAPYVENGSSRQKKQPYLRPALENYGDQYKQIIQRYLQSGS